MGVYDAEGELPDARQGPVPEGAFRAAPVFETNAEGIFCALRASACPPAATRSGWRGGSTS
jgi:hypothetical protein